MACDLLLATNSGRWSRDMHSANDILSGVGFELVYLRTHQITY
jgi:hypothetical protein